MMRTEILKVVCTLLPTVHPGMLSMLRLLGMTVTDTVFYCL